MSTARRCRRRHSNGSYATVAAVLSSIEEPAQNTRILILVDKYGDTLTVGAEVDAPGVMVTAADFVEVADRVGALGGSLTIAENATGTTLVTAVLPCGL